jgi:hypothetical protein
MQGFGGARMKKSRLCLGTDRSLAIVVLLGLTMGQAGATDQVPNISGTYWAVKYNAKIEPVGGGEPPFTAAGKMAYEANVAGLQDGTMTDAARKYCTPDGLPRLLATPYPFEILQAPPGQITMVHELSHQIRAITMDKPLPSQEQMQALPLYNGHSVGHFEGDTLVIESAGFNGGTFLDATGTPHTEDMVTTERVRRVAPAQLEDVITIHDPEYYSADWQARFVYALRQDVRLQDYVCGDKHRDLSSVAGVRAP